MRKITTENKNKSKCDRIIIRIIVTIVITIMFNFAFDVRVLFTCLFDARGLVSLARQTFLARLEKGSNPF